MNFNDQLNEYYSTNGKVFKELEQAEKALRLKGFAISNKLWRNKRGRIAYLTPIRDHIYDKIQRKRQVQKGWLVTFGGKPISYEELRIG